MIIPINFWDDFYDDDHIPDGEIQSTYIYVEDAEISNEKRFEALQILLRYMANNLKLDGVRMWMHFHDSKLEYPTLVGTEHEWCLFQRWEIRVENLTHAKLDEIIGQLESANLSLDGIPFEIYSES